jgi:hypothetical protein
MLDRLAQRYHQMPSQLLKLSLSDLGLDYRIAIAGIEQESLDYKEARQSVSRERHG